MISYNPPRNPSPYLRCTYLIYSSSLRPCCLTKTLPPFTTKKKNFSDADWKNSSKTIYFRPLNISLYSIENFSLCLKKAHRAVKTFPSKQRNRSNVEIGIPIRFIIKINPFFIPPNFFLYISI